MPLRKYQLTDTRSKTKTETSLLKLSEITDFTELEFDHIVEMRVGEFLILDNTTLVVTRLS